MKRDMIVNIIEAYDQRIMQLLVSGETGYLERIKNLCEWRSRIETLYPIEAAPYGTHLKLELLNEELKCQGVDVSKLDYDKIYAILESKCVYDQRRTTTAS